MRTKSERIHHLNRCKLNRKNDWYSGDNEKSLGIHIKTPAKCSCWMCGNPRKHFKMLTIQELKSIQKLQELY